LSFQPKQSEHLIPLPLVDTSEERICLPLVLNVLIRYWGENVPLDEAAEISKRYSGIKGTIMIEGIELAERHGFVSYLYRGSLKDLKRRIDQGIPPIAILPGIHDVVQHATIVSGYDSEERRILTYVPQQDALGAIPESRFEQDWSQDDMITVLLVPKDMRDLVHADELVFSQSNRLCFEAEKLRLQGLIDEAADKLKKATSIDSENSQAWCLLAGMYNELGLEEATKCYEQAVKVNPKCYLAYRGLGNYYLKRKDYSMAEAYYTKAIDLNPQRYGPIYKNRAVARLEIGDRSGAVEDLTRYLEQVPAAPDRKNVEDAIAELK